MILISLMATYVMAQTPPMSVPTRETSEEALLETEVSRSERAEKMKKILKEVRQDLNQRKATKQKTEAPKSDDNTRTN